MSNERFTVVGAGAWGSALASVLADAGHEVILYGRDAQLINDLARTHRNEKYLPGVRLPASIKPLARLGADGPRCGTLVLALPFQVLREFVRNFRVEGYQAEGIVCCSKGIELSSHAFAHDIIAEELGTEMPFAMLSGPTFALEVAKQCPAAVTIGSADSAFAAALSNRFHTGYFRPYSTDDVHGVEIGGAVKNVMAIAAGISDGLSLGANARAALVTRGLAEISRWGRARGGKLETFMGLSGLGDLVLTCTDDLSRNRRFGLSLARGESVGQAIETIGLVEGAKTAIALAELAAEDGVSMPIASQVAAIVTERIPPETAVKELLDRELGVE